jgi:hypothetical protein
MKNPYKILIGEPERSRSFRRHWRRWGSNTKLYLMKQIFRMWPGFNWLKPEFNISLLRAR